MSKDRSALMSALYLKALRRLRARHEEEFAQILGDIYKDAGIDVRRRLTGSRLAAHRAAKAAEIAAKAATKAHASTEAPDF